MNVKIFMHNSIEKNKTIVMRKAKVIMLKIPSIVLFKISPNTVFCIMHCFLDYSSVLANNL